MPQLKGRAGAGASAFRWMFLSPEQPQARLPPMIGKTFTTMLGGRELSIETGKLAKLVSGSGTVRYGDTLLRCHHCPAFVPVTDPMLLDADSLASPPEPHRGRAPTLDRWRCREHPDQSVTWRGRGCRDCQGKAT